MKTIIMVVVVAMLAVCSIVQVNAGIKKVQYEKAGQCGSTDYTCMSDCTKRYSWRYCKSLCSY